MYEFFTIKYDIIVYTNAQYFNAMRVAAEYVRKARGCDRFRLAPMRFARTVTPGSANGDARICEKRFLDRFFYHIYFFFFLFHLFIFFSNIFISRPRHLTAYTLPIPHYTTIVYRVRRSPAAAATQRQFAEFDQFLTLYRSAIGAIPLLLPPSPRVYAHAPSSAAPNPRSVRTTRHSFNDIFRTAVSQAAPVHRTPATDRAHPLDE